MLKRKDVMTSVVRHAKLREEQKRNVNYALKEEVAIQNFGGDFKI